MKRFHWIKICIFLSLVMTILILGACDPSTTESEKIDSFDWPESTLQAQGMDSTLMAEAVEQARAVRYVLSLLVIRNDLLVSENYYYSEYHGMNDAWSIRSATKSYISVLIGIAIDEGFIQSVDERIIDYFSEYVTDDMDPRKQNITIRDLLLMQGGYPSDGQADSLLSGLADMMMDIFTMNLTGEPGQDYIYSSLGTHLLSGILTRATGMNTLDFAEEYLFEPMDMSIAYWDRDPQDIPFGGAGLNVTPRDMARFGQLILHNGSVDGRRIVSSGWITESLQKHLQFTGDWLSLENIAFGYLWWLGKLNGHEAILAVGYAGQFIVIVPDLDLIVVTTATFPFTVQEGSAQSEFIMQLIAEKVVAAAH